MKIVKESQETIDKIKNETIRENITASKWDAPLGLAIIIIFVCGIVRIIQWSIEAIKHLF